MSAVIKKIDQRMTELEAKVSNILVESDKDEIDKSLSKTKNDIYKRMDNIEDKIHSYIENLRWKKK